MSIELDFGAILIEWPQLLKGVGWTLFLTLSSTVIGVSVGSFFSWIQWQKKSIGIHVVSLYVESIRNTPFIIQLFFIFFGLPSLGIKLSAEWASVVAMSINLGAYSTEIIRAGVEAIDRGQIEAAYTLALSRAQTFKRVILPQAYKKIWPSLVSQIIIVMLGSSVCGQVSTEELSYAANLIQSRNFRAFEAFIIAATIYLALCILLRSVLNRLGQRYLFGTRRG